MKSKERLRNGITSEVTRIVLHDPFDDVSQSKTLFSASDNPTVELALDEMGLRNYYGQLADALIGCGKTAKSFWVETAKDAFVHQMVQLHSHKTPEATVHDSIGDERQTDGCTDQRVGPVTEKELADDQHDVLVATARTGRARSVLVPALLLIQNCDGE